MSFIFLANQLTVLYIKGNKIGNTEAEKEVNRSSIIWLTQGGVVRPDSAEDPRGFPGYCLQEVCQAMAKSIFFIYFFFKPQNHGYSQI